MSKFGITVPLGYVADSVDKAADAENRLGQGPWVVKAQIHAGGRGEAGGVKKLNSIDELKAYANDTIGKNLVTRQTGKMGKKVGRQT